MYIYIYIYTYYKVSAKMPITAESRVVPVTGGMKGSKDIFRSPITIITMIMIISIIVIYCYVYYL